jgi:hypothetical protein
MIKKFAFVTSFLALLLAGCASAPKATDTHSGFLTDYSKLQESDDNTASYRAEGYDPKDYGKITFAPVEVHLSQQLLEGSSMEAGQQEEISRYVADELNRKLSSGFSGQGVGTLKVRAAVSGVSSSSEDLSAWQYLPITLAATAAMEAAGQRDKALVLFLEAEAIDEASGEIVAAKITASELGLVDNSDFEEDPVGTIKPLLTKWIEKLLLDINKQLQ